jgi:hypothetical protein
MRALVAILLGAVGAGCDRAPSRTATTSPATAVADAPPSHDPPWRSAPREAMCVTRGALLPRDRGRFAVDAPTFRAVSPLSGRLAELAFTYEGPTSTARPLGSGDVRSQIGLKLRAHDACNLVYAMWRLGPDGQGRLVVQWKRNDGQTKSSECGNRGYQTVKPRSAAALPSVVEGARHVLRAELEGDDLRLLVDGSLAWEGPLPAGALALRGPIGLRSDNVRFEGELRAAEGTSAPCEGGGEASEE